MQCIIALLVLVGVAQADPVESANDAFVRFWNTARKVVVIDARKPNPARPPPLREQLLRIRDELLPMLELDLKHDVEHWLADVDTAVSQFNEGRWHRLSQAIAYANTLRNAGRTAAGFHPRWMDDPVAKKLSAWLPFAFDPLMREPERAVTEGDELMVLWGWRLEPLFQETSGWPVRTRLWWRVIKPAKQEAAEAELARRAAARAKVRVYRKVVLVATLRARADGWIIERLGWLDRPPGRR